MPSPYERLQAILAERDGHAAVTRRSVDMDVLTRKGAVERMADLDEKFGWTVKLAELRAEAAADLAKAEAAVAGIIETATTPADGDPLLNELQLGRAWNRMRLALDKVPDAGKLAAVSNALAAATSPIERAALLQEGPAYLAASEHRDPTPALHKVLAQSVPELAAAQAAALETGKVFRIMDDNASYVERQLNHSDERVGPRHDLALTDPAEVAPLTPAEA